MARTRFVFFLLRLYRHRCYWKKDLYIYIYNHIQVRIPKKARMSVLGKKSHFVVVAEDINDLGEARVLDPDAMGKTFLESLFHGTDRSVEG